MWINYVFLLIRIENKGLKSYSISTTLVYTLALLVCERKGEEEEGKRTSEEGKQKEKKVAERYTCRDRYRRILLPGGKLIEEEVREDGKGEEK